MVLYNGMASTSPCAALYFVALMTFGNYVLFNLLVAILVEGFQAEVRLFIHPRCCSLAPEKPGHAFQSRLHHLAFSLLLLLERTCFAFFFFF